MFSILNLASILVSFLFQFSKRLFQKKKSLFIDFFMDFIYFWF